MEEEKTLEPEETAAETPAGSPAEAAPAPAAKADREARRAERQKYLRRQQMLRIAGIAAAIALALAALLVSCSTRSMVKELSEQLAAKKAAQAALLAESSADAAAPEDSLAEDPEPVSAVETLTAEAPHETKTVTMSFAGDCTFASYYGAAYSGSFEQYYDENGEDYFFENVRSIFEGDDLTVVNLEGTFTTASARVLKLWTFRSDPSYVGILPAASIECVNLANNHTGDYYDTGYEETIATLDDADIAHFGGADTALLDVNGISIGFSGIYECESGIGCLDQAVENVESLKAQGAELIVCEFHWGDENSYSPNSIHTELAHAVIDAGADLVIAHHPHVLQGIEEYNGKYICYSMGNFCFGGNNIVNDKDSMIYQTTFTLVDGEVQPEADYVIIPCSISTESYNNTYCPTPAEGEEKERILDKIYSMSEALSGGITRPAESAEASAADTAA